MDDVFLLRQRLGELDLVVIQQLGVRDYDQGHGDAQRVEDCSGAFFMDTSTCGTSKLRGHECTHTCVANHHTLATSPLEALGERHIRAQPALIEPES